MNNLHYTTKYCFSAAKQNKYAYFSAEFESSASMASFAEAGVNEFANLRKQAFGAEVTNQTIFEAPKAETKLVENNKRESKPAEFKPEDQKVTARDLQTENKVLREVLGKALNKDKEQKKMTIWDLFIQWLLRKAEQAGQNSQNQPATEKINIATAIGESNKPVGIVEQRELAKAA